MRFKPTDKEWSDYHQKGGLSKARRKRYERLIEAIMDGLEQILKENNEGHTINAMVPLGLFATGVIGDRRMYAPFVRLTYGSAPNYDHLQRISTAITNTLPISRVVYTITHKVICIGEVQFLIRRYPADLVIQM